MPRKSTGKEAAQEVAKRIATEPAKGKAKGRPQETVEARKRRISRAITDALPAPEPIRDAWGRLIVDTVLPDGVWSRQGLSPRDRSMITVAALTALYRPNELRIHLGRALDNGVTRAELGELIMHMAIYGGFPVAVEGMRIAREVFDTRTDAD
jgi:4-carboxymuconolactone decarboxylase